MLGGQGQLARDKRGVRFLGGVIGEGVGKLYVARYFPPDAKDKAQDLVRNLLSVYRQRIETADWMSPATRAKALEKVGNFTVKIGYPDKWRDYSKFEVKPTIFSAMPSAARNSNGIASWCGSISRSTAANGACRRKP